MTWNRARISEVVPAVLPALLAAALVGVVMAGAAQPSVALLGAAAVLLVSIVVVARSGAVVMGPGNVAAGARAVQQRKAALAEPAPQHPDTAGRPRSRAPSQPPTAA